MKEKDFFTEIQSKYASELISPTLYKCMCQDNPAVQHWTGLQILVCIAQNNNVHYNVLQPPVEHVLVKQNQIVIKLKQVIGNDTLTLPQDPKLMERPDNILIAQISFKEESPYLIAATGKTRHIAQTKLDYILAQDVVRTLHITDKAQLTTLFSQAVQIYCQNQTPIASKIQPVPLNNKKG